MFGPDSPARALSVACWCEPGTTEAIVEVIASVGILLLGAGRRTVASTARAVVDIPGREPEVGLFGQLGREHVDLLDGRGLREEVVGLLHQRRTSTVQDGSRTTRARRFLLARLA